MVLSHASLAGVFNLCFSKTYNVCCLGGYEQPEYLTAEQTQGPAQLRYTRDYPASALHEIAHWCIAGRLRLDQPDFGYGYLPPPRDRATQQQFFALELKAQTIEAWFAMGTGVRFVASADNFECSDADRQTFAAQITCALRFLTLSEMPPRAKTYASALIAAGLATWPSLPPNQAQGTDSGRV